MAVFLNDLFTEASNLSLGLHTPNTGGTWVQRNVSSGGTSRDLRVTGGTGNLNIITGEGLFTNSATPAGTGHRGECVWTPTANNQFLSLVFNWTGEGTFYQAVLDNYSNQVRLEKLSAWSSTTIGTAVSFDLVNGTAYKIGYELTVEGSNKRLKLYLDDVEQRNEVDTSPLSGVGLVGVRMDNGDCTSIFAEDVGGGGSSVGAGLVASPLINSRLLRGLVR